LLHRGARFVVVLRRLAPGHERWWVPHRTAPDWRAILSAELALLGLAPEPGSNGDGLTCRLGHVGWTTARGWSTISLRLSGGSETKRRLVAAALLKGARYARSARHIPEEDRWPA
jgi:hypothetical protein